MKGTEHFRRAEQLLELAREVSKDRPSWAEEHISTAQVHAILAAATAMSNLVTVWGDIAGMMRADSELVDAEPCGVQLRGSPSITCELKPGHDGDHIRATGGPRYRWENVFDAEPPRAEPLVTCNAAPADDGPERCGLPLGHDGLHEDQQYGSTVSWSTPDELRTIAPESESRRCGVPSAHGMSHCWCSITEHHYPSADPEQRSKLTTNASEPALLYESTATDMHMEMPR